jgi:prevent-host-death family protein
MTSSDYHVTMKTVGVAEFKARLSEYLRAVRRGHEITILDRDQPIAKVSPYTGSGTLVVREPGVAYAKPSDVQMPPAMRLRVDPVDLLLEDRGSEE